MREETQAVFQERTGALLLNADGATEMAFAVFFGDRDPGGRGAISVGRPALGEARVRAGPRAGGRRGEGELELRGPSRSDGYWGNPEATAEAFMGDWYRTGDLVRRDEAGRYTHRGRVREIVLRGGFTIHLSEVEDAVLAVPGVLDACAVRIRPGEVGEDVGVIARAGALGPGRGRPRRLPRPPGAGGPPAGRADGRPDPPGAERQGRPAARPRCGAACPREPARRDADVAAGFDHPVIDSDCHLIEYLPDVVDRIADLSGPDLARRFERHLWTMDQTYRIPRALGRQRHDPAAVVELPRTKLARAATAMLPALLHERLPEIGIDVAVVYAPYFIVYFTFDDDEYRQVACRATNDHVAEMSAGLEDRLLPVASIPMHTPAEALAELEHCAGLGYRAFVFAGAVTQRDGSGRTWVDTTSVETGHDYDPVWRMCEENGWAATSTPRAWAGAGGSPATTTCTTTWSTSPRRPTRSPGACCSPAPSPATPTCTRSWRAGRAGRDVSRPLQPLRQAQPRDDPRLRPHDHGRGAGGQAVRALRQPRVAQRLDRLDAALLPLSAPMAKVPDEFSGPRRRRGRPGPHRSIFSTQIFAGCEGDDPSTPCSAGRRPTCWAPA